MHAGDVLVRAVLPPSLSFLFYGRVSQHMVIWCRAVFEVFEREVALLDPRVDEHISGVLRVHVVPLQSTMVLVEIIFTSSLRGEARFPNLLWS